ncbi:MAG TPA: HSP20 family small heat-shock protein [Kofleriaceae bacterium]|nr:HSP20 family small heat-shock protein [Kofleriaceae bacterium]HMG55194.1 HSP20 family small heat-shock protein [Kofleriaceae bacterium]
MSLLARTNGNTTPARYVARDPFQVARDLLSWDPFFGGGRQSSAFIPAFEVKETDEAFVLKGDLPGVADADLDIAVHNNVLTVSGTRHAEQRKEGDSFALYERQYGSFSRSFSLPDTADGDRIEAALSSGVLTLTIWKKAEAKPRKIAVQK